MTAATPVELFSASVRNHPDEPALEAGGVALTYQELDDVVDGVCGLMLAGGRGIPRRVGIVCSRSATTYAAYLAALRLGAAAVPLSASCPVGRIRQMCVTAGVDLIVCDTAEAAQLTEELAVPRVVVDHRPARPAGRVEQVPPDPDGIAYVLFTSGSTGVPKGVPISNRNVAAYLAGQVGQRDAGPGCRFSQTFDLTFDPSVFDMFVAWGSGATLVVPDGCEVLTPVAYVNRRRITHWFSVPSVISMAWRTGALPPGSMPSLRWSLFIGEQLTLEQAAAWSRAAPDSVVENLYGPTELTVSCASYRLPRERDCWPVVSNGTVPIGRVSPNLEGVVLDENGAPVREGELCVRGDQRIAGYLDPKMNADRFLDTDHRGPAHGYDRGEPVDPRHWYRTGDRVRLADDGNLVHLGRMDDQIKLRGYRIEPGDVETALRRYAGVPEAVVMAAPGKDGEPELVAAYTGARRGVGELVAAVGGALPAYMVPDRFVHLSEVPLTANRKTDRHRLARLLTPSARAGVAGGPGAD